MNDEGDSNYKTIQKLRVPKSIAPLARDLLVVSILLLGFALGLAMFAGVQYWTCTLRNPDVTLMQCIRAEPVKGKK